jgi:hypothetical protein
LSNVFPLLFPAGTTFIDHYLQKHPQAIKHSKKEIFFFSQQHFNGIEWYFFSFFFSFFDLYKITTNNYK